MLRRLILAGVFSAAIPLVPAAFAQSGGVTVMDAWVRPMGAGADSTSAVYATIHNGSAQADTLLSASTAVAATAELHRMTRSKDGMMQMLPVKGGLAIPAHGQVVLKPGAYHVMLTGLKQPIAPGDHVPVVLHFAKAGEVTVSAVAEQRGMGDKAAGGHEGMPGMEGHGKAGHEMGKH